MNILDHLFNRYIQWSLYIEYFKNINCQTEIHVFVPVNHDHNSDLIHVKSM